MSSAALVKNIFLRFNPATARRFLDYFWKNGKVAESGKLILPKRSIGAIRRTTELSGFSPGTLRMMARDRLKLSEFKGNLEKIPSYVQDSPKVASIMNRDWSSRLPKGWIRKNHYGHELSPQMTNRELDELRNHLIQPTRPFPKLDWD